MLRAVVEVDDEKYEFEDKEHIKTTIVIRRDPSTSEFPLMELYFEKENPKYKEPYSAYVGDGTKILEYAVFEYSERNGVSFYEGYLDFDVNEYKLSDSKDELEIVIDFE